MQWYVSSTASLGFLVLICMLAPGNYTAAVPGICSYGRTEGRNRESAHATWMVITAPWE